MAGQPADPAALEAAAAKVGYQLERPAATPGSAAVPTLEAAAKSSAADPAGRSLGDVL